MDPEERKQLILQALRTGEAKYSDLSPEDRNLLSAGDPSFFGRLGGIGQQVGAGLGEVIPTAALGLGELFNSDAPTQIVDKVLPGDVGSRDAMRARLEELRRETAPDQPGEGLARFVGRGAGEAALGAVPGGMVARGARALPTVLGQAATGGVISQAGPEESTAGMLSSFFPENETLAGVAENPLARGISEVATSLGLDAALSGARALRGRAPTPKPSVAESVEYLRATRTPENSAHFDRLAEIDEELDFLNPATATEQMDLEMRPLSLKARSGQALTPEEEGRAAGLQSRREDIVSGARRARLEAERQGIVEEAQRISRGEPPTADLAARQDLPDDEHVWAEENKPALKRLAHWFWNREKQIDRHNPILRGTPAGMPSLMDPEVQARNMTGADGYAANIFQYGVHGYQEEKFIPRSKGAMQILNDVPDVRAFQRYLTALQAQIRQTQGKTIPANIKKNMNEWLKVGGDPTFARAATDWADYKREMLLLLEEEGLISQGGAGRIIAEGNTQYFVPFLHVDESGKRVRPGVVASDPVHRFDGGTTKIVDPLIASVRQDFYYARLIARHRMQKAVATIGDLGVSDKVKRVEGTPAGLIPWMDDLPSPKDDVVDSFLTHKPEKQFYTTRRGERYVDFKDAEGKSRWYKVDPDYFEALINTPVDHTSGLEKFFAGWASAKRTGVVLNIPFQVFNFGRDLYSRAAFSPSLEARTGKIPRGLRAPTKLFLAADEASSALATLVADQLSQLPLTRRVFKPQEIVRVYESSGGAQSHFLGLDQDHFEKMLARVQGMQGNRAQQFRHGMKYLRDFLRTVEGSVEVSNRLAEFDSSLRQAPGDVARAGYNAADVTVDFRRHGQAYDQGIGRGIRRASAFWQAGVSGLDRLHRGFRDPRTGKINKEGVASMTELGFTTLTIPALAIYASNRRNEDWWNLSEPERALFLHIPFPSFAAPDDLTVDPNDPETAGRVFRHQGSTTFLRVPVPHDLGWGFATGPVAFLSAMDPRNPHRGSQTAQALGVPLKAAARAFSQILPAPEPLWTGAQLATNTDWFRDQPIDSPYDMDLEPAVRSPGEATDLAQTISRTLDDAGMPTLSPKQMDFTAGSLGGGLGRAVMSGLSELPGIRPSQFGVSPEERWTEHEAIRRMFTDTRGMGRLTNQFWDEYNELQNRKTTGDRYAEQGFPKLAEQHGLSEEEAIRLEILDYFAEGMSDIRAHMEQVAADPDLTADEKRAEQNDGRAAIQALLKVASYSPQGRSRYIISNPDLPEEYRAWAVRLNELEEISTNP